MAFTISITGHIDLAYPQKVKTDIIYFLRYLKKTHGEITAISTMASGSDTIFAEAVLEEKVALRIIFPFQPEDYKKDFTAKDWKNVQKIMARNGGEYEVFSTINYNDEKERKAAYLQAGKESVDESNILLAVWDSKGSNGTGGTADIVKYAEQQAKQLHIIRGVRIGQVRPDSPQEIFYRWDDSAISLKKYRFTLTWIIGILIGLAAVLLFAVKTIFVKDESVIFLLSVLEFLSLIVSFILLDYFADSGKTRFLTERRDTEYVRSAMRFGDAGIPIPKINIEGYNPGARAIKLENDIAAEITNDGNFFNSKRSVWSLVSEQIDYQNNTRKRRNDIKLHRMSFYLHLIKWIFFILVALNFGFEALEHFHIETEIDYDRIIPWFFFFLTILPPIYAAIEGVKYFGEYKKEIEMSDNTIQALEKLLELIERCKDDHELNTLTPELREILEKENIDWTKRLAEKQIEKAPDIY